MADVILQKVHFALLPGDDFYFPSESLTARISYVDYDGSKALKAVEDGEAIDAAFLRKYCPNIVSGLDSLEKFLTAISC